MYILSGKFKGLRLKTPKSDKTRPTLAKVRGSVFDILQNQIQDAKFLDLFAGSGAMGIEAVSRGAKQATFVEKDRKAAFCIRENLQTCRVEAKVFQTDCENAIKRFADKKERFDIIYVDPPYTLPIESILENLPSILEENGLILLEQSKKTKILAPKLQQVDERNFGDTTIYFFVKK